MSEPSQAAIDAAATLLSRYSSPVRQQAAEIIQVAIDAEKANAMKENISLRLAVGDDTISLLSKLEAERQKTADLRDTLEYYANDEMYEPDWSDGKETILKDRGREARKALGRSS